ncbi:MAG: CDP-alcohol phosphatidyltransferase family protein [Acidimicrobiales bacterium]|nr:CDP-alcohol phosphatidyltransferase family protein [Acidimicrobiales bacterium]MDG1844823.1 CDP-alcohol phosphatidyltransferase family protein [Acidimicrobiales bacterium]
MFDGNLRTAVDRILDPIGAFLCRLRVTADALTVTGILIAVAGAIVIGQGHMFVGFVCLILTGIPDALDGAVAKAAGTSSVRGAFFDSVSDRVTDSLLFCGIAWHFASTEPGRIMMLPVAVMAIALLVSYQRAKAESLGYDAKGGIMERAERFIVLALGLLIDQILIPVLWVMLVLTAFTACQRFLKVWKQASKEMNLSAGDQK